MHIDSETGKQFYYYTEVNYHIQIIPISIHGSSTELQSSNEVFGVSVLEPGELSFDTIRCDIYHSKEMRDKRIKEYKEDIKKFLTKEFQGLSKDQKGNIEEYVDDDGNFMISSDIEKKSGHFYCTHVFKIVEFSYQRAEEDSEQ